MKSTLSQFIPPILLKILRPTRKSLSYKTYEEALLHCTKDGYESKDIVKVVIDKNILFNKQIKESRVLDLSTLKTIVGISLVSSQKKLRVIDFGGGGGYHYTIAKSILPEDIELKWNIVETPAMVNEGQRISTNDLKFFDTVEKAHQDLGVVDLVFTSGALHCCPNPILQLEKLIDVKAQYIYITRTSFTNTLNQLVNVQKSYLSTNGPGPLPEGYIDRAVLYPNVFIPLEMIEKIINKKYLVKFKLLEEKAVYNAGGIDIDMFGYFCIKKSII